MDTKVEVTNLITPFINTFKTINNELKHLFDIGISDYLQNQTEKYYFTNTFIHSEKVPFDSIYYPIHATYKALTTNFYDLNSILENYKNLTIVGSAGSGKTTLIKHIFLHSIRTTNKIPLLIELRFLNDYEGDFTKLITERLLNARVKPTDDTFKRALQSGSFIFLLDGYDEIFSNRKQELNRQIETFVDSYSKNNFIITTRPGGGIEKFPRFYDFKVNHLTNEDVEGFINKIVDSEERIDRILKIINDPKNNNYIEYLRNPLLLSMFILAFENHPEIPSKKSSFYRNVFDTLYSKHDGITKNSFAREKLTKFERDEFEKILSIFSYLTTIAGKYTFTEEHLTDTLSKVLSHTTLICKIEHLIYDLHTTISILVLDGFEYSFPHRSMQEYFTAKFISSLPSESKVTAYNNLANSLIKLSTDNSFNMWSMCNELDGPSFKLYFLIPQLEKFYNLFTKTKSDNELFDRFVEAVDTEVVHGCFREDVKRKELLLFREPNFFNSLIKFCNVYDYRVFFSFSNEKEVKKEILQALKLSSRYNKKITEHAITPKIKRILIEYGICQIIKDYNIKIFEKIEELKLEIELDKTNINDLLKL